MTSEQVVEIFGLKVPAQPWKQREETYNAPQALIFFLSLLQKAGYDTSSEAYSRIQIEFMIITCMVKHRNLLSKQSELPTDQSKLSANNPTIATSPTPKQSELLTDDPHDQTATIVPVLDQAIEIARPSYIAPTAPLMAPESTCQPLPIKVFPEMALSVQVKRGSQEWDISGIADWALGYGSRAALEDATVLLAVEAKEPKFFASAEAQLLAYLATIRQLRIQANKKNVMTQGFYSNGENYRFLCIRNDGTVMKSRLFDVSWDETELKSVFNFLLSMLNTAAKSSPNTSPAKPGPEQNGRIGNFDQEVFVEVFEDIGMENVSKPIPYYGELDVLPDLIMEEE